MATKHFYYLCLIGITLLGGCVILLLHRKLAKSSESKGMIFISLGLFSFAIIGLYKFFDPPIPALLLSDIDRIFSVFTNIFFVAALPFFSNVFVKFRSYVPLFRKKDAWVNSVFIFFAFLAAVFAVIERNVVSEFGENVIIFIDSVSSTTTIGLVAYAFYKSITGIWSDLLTKLFVGTMLVLFPLSQILLPLTVLVPTSFSHLYFPALLALLIGITFFIFTAIIYYCIAAAETVDEAETDTLVDNTDELYMNALSLGYDSLKKVYFIEIEFIKNNERFKERIENRKILLPFSNWILFSVAKKLNVKLLSNDIALTKFRMVEYWNKDAETKLNQEFIFTNDMGLFEFNIDANAIEIINVEQLKSKLIITEAIKKNSDNFTNIFPNKDKSSIEASEIFEMIR